MFCTSRTVIESSPLVISFDRINLSVCMSNITQWQEEHTFFQHPGNLLIQV